MSTPMFVVFLAVVALVVVSTALCRQARLLRWRRDVDQYLHWLMEDAIGPLGLTPPPRWF